MRAIVPALLVLAATVIGAEELKRPQPAGQVQDIVKTFTSKTGRTYTAFVDAFVSEVGEDRVAWLKRNGKVDVTFVLVVDRKINEGRSNVIGLSDFDTAFFVIKDDKGTIVSKEEMKISPKMGNGCSVHLTLKSGTYTFTAYVKQGNVLLGGSLSRVF